MFTVQDVPENDIFYDEYKYYVVEKKTKKEIEIH